MEDFPTVGNEIVPFHNRFNFYSDFDSCCSSSDDDDDLIAESAMSRSMKPLTSVSICRTGSSHCNNMHDDKSTPRHTLYISLYHDNTCIF
jgi:hypothetical protein